MKKEELFFLVAALFVIIIFVAFATAAPSWQTGFPGTIFNTTEDIIFTYNFTKNVSNILNESILFEILNVSVVPDLGLGNSPSNYTWININVTTGNLTVNSSTDNQTGYFTVTVFVKNASNSAGPADLFYFNTSAVNDAPFWRNLTDKEMNITEMFNYTIQAADEEGNIPFTLNLTFPSCITAEWSTRANSNCTLFTPNEYTFNNLTGVLNFSFTPSRNDVGNYTLRFVLNDSLGKSNTTNVNFSVYNINVPPYFRYACDSERNTTENSVFTCIVNVSDVDEINNLTIRSLVNTTGTWFTFNGSGTNLHTLRVNASTSFNATFLVNFTSSDIRVGNWSINLTLNDTGDPSRSNSTVFYFYVANVPDGVHLQNLSPVNAFTSNNYTVYIDGYDDDLLVPDKNAFNEVLTFSSNDSRVFIQSVNTTANRTLAQMIFNGSNFSAAVYYVNISINDSGNSHVNSTLLVLNFSTNNPPIWNSSLVVNYTLNENVTFYLNLTANVSDAENDALTFSFSNDSAFPTFGIGSSTGVINFTPADGDVGRHTVVINASDGKVNTPLSVTFTAYNLNESPRIVKPFTAGDNITVNSASSNLSATEDSRANFVVLIDDEDFKIQDSQKSYYNESLTINLSITGPNTGLFNLTSSGLITTNRTQYEATFTPNKSDVGNYNITLNVSDVSGLTDLIQFNLTIASINHNPNLSAIANQTSRVNASFSLDLNASDIEDGSDNGNLTYNITFIEGINFIGGNATIFNITTGLLNITFNDTHPGIYRLNVTVNDSTQLRSSRDFTLNVYGVPSILTPAAGVVFNVSENNVSNLTFTVNHSVQDNLTLYFYINGELRHNVTSYGNGSNVTWAFTPTFLDEGYGVFKNLTLTVVNPTFALLNATRNYSINISHTNAPLVFNGTIASQQKNYDQTIFINMSTYFSDLDSNDSRYNQTLSFIVASNMSSNSTITVTIVNGSLNNTPNPSVTFSAGAEALESFNITGNDSFYSNVSNSFTIQFTTPSTVTVPSSSSSGGGGGGSSQIKPISLNIIVPGPLTARKQDRLIVPIGLINDGKIGLNAITLRNAIAKNGILREDLLAAFDRSFIEQLLPGQRENLTLIVDVDTRDPGLYEITLNGTSANPIFSDTAKLYVNVEEGDTVAERISFTQEFIAQNPQCIEIKELIDEARELYIQGDMRSAQDKAEQALQACQNAISQASRVQQRDRFFQTVTDNIGIASVVALLVGLAYYWFRRIRMQRSFEAD